jgi:hypothetical protein
LQAPSSITLGPQSPFRLFTQAEVRAELHGAQFKRPTFHLISFPEGKGPGFHLVDSVTGRVDIIFEKSGARRRLLTFNALNSSKTSEVLSMVWADANDRWIAALLRDQGGWKLNIFPLS